MKLMLKELSKLRKEDKAIIKKQNTMRAPKTEKSSTNVVETVRPLTGNITGSNHIRNRV